MFCPQCKAEYRRGFTHCSDCDVDLVGDLTSGTEQTEISTWGIPEPEKAFKKDF
jgi:hypothetical protein